MPVGSACNHTPDYRRMLHFRRKRVDKANPQAIWVVLPNVSRVG